MVEKNSIAKHPHDAFFKGTFAKKEIAKAFLKNYLQEEILKCVDLDTLENQNGEYIDKKLKKEFSDLLYQVEINGEEGYIYILFEHKSYEDQKVIFQLLRYMTRIWEERYDTKTKKIPMIIPLVIYHGKKKFEQKTRLWEYINGIEKMPEIMKQMTPRFEYKQYDYSPESELEIKGRAILQAVLKILKAIREKERTDLIEGFMEFVLSVENEKDIQLANEVFDLGLAYITNIERMAIGFLLINFFTPFSVKKEIEDDQNVSLGIIIGAVIIGISIIIAAVISSPSSQAPAKADADRAAVEQTDK